MAEKEIKIQLNVDSRKAESSIKKTSTNIKNLGDSTNKLTSSTNKAKTETDKYNRSLKKQASIIGTKNSGLIGSMGGLKVAIGVGITAGFTMAIIAGAKFERQMATVKGIMRATTIDLEKMSNAALEMGSNSEHGANKAAEALKFMGMAGYTASEAIESLPGMLQLATASGLDLASVSDIVTDSMTALGLETKDLGRFNDVLTGVTSRTNTNILQLGESLKYVAPIAYQLGYEVEDLSSYLGILANAGIKGSMAGTSLSQAMVRNVKISKQFNTAQGDLIGTLKAAKAAGWGVKEIMQEYGQESGKSVLILMDQIEKFGELRIELDNVKGETQKLNEVKLDTVTGQWNLLKSSVLGIGVEISGIIDGPLKVMLEKLVMAASGVKNILKEISTLRTPMEVIDDKIAFTQSSLSKEKNISSRMKYYNDLAVLHEEKKMLEYEIRELKIPGAGNFLDTSGWSFNEGDANAKALSEEEAFRNRMFDLNTSIRNTRENVPEFNTFDTQSNKESDPNYYGMNIYTDQKIIEEAKEVRKTAYEEWCSDIKSMQEKTEEFNMIASESFASGASNAWTDFILGTKTAKEALEDFANSFAREMLNMLAKRYILDILKNGFDALNKSSASSGSGGWQAVLGMVGSFFGGSTGGGTITGAGNSPMMVAKGGIFSDGIKSKFASGGVVESPTLFPMSGGNGLMGEAGPEAIMPLKRTSSGNLGVETTGSTEQAPNQTIIINAIDTKSFAEAIERNPGSIISIVNEALEDNTELRQTIRSTM